MVGARLGLRVSRRLYVPGRDIVVKITYRDKCMICKKELGDNYVACPLCGARYHPECVARVALCSSGREWVCIQCGLVSDAGAEVLAAAERLRAEGVEVKYRC